MVPQYPLYMNFISNYANNSFGREQFRKEKDACLASKSGSYTQVDFVLLILNIDNVDISRALSFVSGRF